MGRNRGWEDSEFIKDLRTSAVVENYRFKGEATRHVASVDFVIHLELGIEDKNSRGTPPTPPSSINRILQNGYSSERNSRWGMGDTYDHALRRPHIDGYYGGNRRSDSQRTLHRRNRPDQYSKVNCAFGGDLDGEDDNAN